MNVGFQGEAGAFSEEAALALFGDVRTVGYRTFDDLVDAVDSEDVSMGLIPCENTIYGSIARTYDLLDAHPRVRIVNETTHRIRQALIGVPGAAVEHLRRVESHPVALEQCRAFLRAHPEIAVEAVDDTAGAVRAMMERNDPSVGSIGPALAAQRYRACVLVANVQDDVENVTRFFAVARTEASHARMGRACLALNLPHRPGSLHAALGTIAARNLNLRSLVARPTRAAPFQYTFYVELECPDDATLTALRDDLDGAVRILGAY